MPSRKVLSDMMPWRKVLLDMMPCWKLCLSVFSVLIQFPSQNCFLLPWKTLIDENQLQQTKSSELLGLVFLPSDYWIPLHGRQMLLIKPLIFPEGGGRQHDKKRLFVILSFYQTPLQRKFLRVSIWWIPCERKWSVKAAKCKENFFDKESGILERSRILQCCGKKIW